MYKTIISTFSNLPHRLMVYIERGGHGANLNYGHWPPFTFPWLAHGGGGG